MGPFSQRAKKTGLYKGISTRYQELLKVKTWFQERIQIEGVWFSDDIEVFACGALPFGFSIVDHRGFFVDVAFAALVRKYPLKIPRLKARQLQSWIPKVWDKHNGLCMAQMVSQKLIP